MNLNGQSLRRLCPLLLGLAVVPFFSGCMEDANRLSGADDVETSIQSPHFSPEVQGILDRKCKLVETLATNERILSAVRRANEENKALSEHDIQDRDARWRAAVSSSDFVKPFLTNDCAQALLEFQKSNDSFSEILVTDARGLIVGASNKSSDYLQADEAWWVAAYDGGRGQTFTGPIEYDESSRSQAISVYVPIVDPQSGKAIGVIKAVCDVTAIKREL